MQNKKIFFLYAFSLFKIPSFSQDTLYFLKGPPEIVRISEVQTSTVKYWSYHDKDSIQCIANRAELVGAKYRNGEIDIFLTEKISGTISRHPQITFKSSGIYYYQGESIHWKKVVFLAEDLARQKNEKDLSRLIIKTKRSYKLQKNLAIAAVPTIAVGVLSFSYSMVSALFFDGDYGGLELSVIGGGMVFIGGGLLLTSGINNHIKTARLKKITKLYNWAS